MQINNVTLQHSDGGMGLAQYAPYDAILVTAAADQVPAELLTQLAIGGTMVIPVGAAQGQQLKLIIKKSASNYQTKVVEAVNFVPLLSGIIS